MRRQLIDTCGLCLQRCGTVVLEIILEFGALEKLHCIARIDQVLFLFAGIGFLCGLL